ncbi:conserved hypothetical protein [Uncinocarpus reesii 1704]|uniref:Probable E3 ubiquitin ligase complex SCF subunit sconB n=1 Tax=Uncinocarpus reesii (strain UAMH 1704) TaxID=336963 RepID=C4JZD1_UNCRE|nr:uncharacterized protein UREG_07532 [Uncinocarpus reesii 1704]EEP82667.1 conserved hypothetical protein [Uncinocarpus reesii 1704]
MSPGSANNSRSVRRQASFLSRVRPKTAGAEQGVTRPLEPFHPAIWAPSGDGSYKETVSHFYHEPAIPSCGDTELHRPPITTNSGPLVSSSPIMGRRHHSKSISCIRHSVSELRAAVRRFSFTIRHKSHKHTLEVPQERGSLEPYLEGHYRKESKHGGPRGNCMHRQSFSTLHPLNRSQSHTLGISPPIPANTPDLPLFPEELSGGDAARAAAAAQNEIIRLERVTSGADTRGFEIIPRHDTKPSLDSESGIEINIQDSICGSEDDLDVVRKDPVAYLPTELMCHVLSFLDAESVKNAELVSHAWNSQASSRHVWREVFRHEHRHGCSTASSKAGKARAMGLGKVRPNQDWKKMYAVRRALESRWKQGKAAAIYLHGHKDSVYCVQFDENKIITGSRDRTIRVWDAHYPWPCLKVIGALQDRTDSAQIGPLAINPPPDSPGSAPFISICPPAKSASEVMKEDPHAQDYHRASILCLQFDDEIMVTGSSDFTCIVWDINNDYKPIRRLDGHRAGVLDVCFDDRYIISCSKDTTICVWDRHTGELVKKLLGHRGPVNAVQLRGDLVVSASGDGVAKLWNITSGLCIKEFASRDRGLACVEFSEDARTILAGGNDQVIYQFDANTGELVNELKGHTGLVRSLHMDNEHGRVISGSYDMSVKVFDAKSGELSIDLPGWTTSWMLSAKSDYRRIVATSQDSRAVIMDFGYGLDGIELLEE